MFKAIKIAQKGFTIIELLIVIAIIAILALFVINNIQGGQAKARDQQRVNDLGAIKNKLEDLHNETGAYPEAISEDNLPGIEPEALKDPLGGNPPANNNAVADAEAAEDVAGPSNDGNDTASYLYIPYGCNEGSCSGYRLKTFIEKPTSSIGNPYTVNSLN